MRVNPSFRRRRSDKKNEQGYVLLAVIMLVALMLIAAAAIAPDIATQIRRERELELIHRGTQYARAIKRYYKKFGRYPARIEDLENTNNMRFLRRRYKDPLTGKDFLLLHFGEVKMFSQGVAGLASPGAGMMGGAAAAAMGGAFGQSAMGTAGLSPTANPTGSPGMTSPDNSSTNDANTAAVRGQAAGEQPDALATKVFGGGPIVGVASTSHKDTIREFNKKHHYNEWQFVYDPSLDRGGLLNGPAQPPLAGAGGSVMGNPAAAGSSGINPGGNTMSPGMSPGFANPALQGPGAMVPAQPQNPPQQ